MKHTNIIIAAFICTAFSISACITDIEYDGPDSKSLLVVNCIAQDSCVPQFHLSRSRSFLEYYTSNDDFTGGVDVRVNINGVEKSAAYDAVNKGFNDGRPVFQGDIITVTATHPDYGKIIATDTVPYAQEIRTDDYLRQYVHNKTISEAFDDYYYDFDDSKVDSSWVVELEIQDRKNAADYYIMSIKPEMTYLQKFEDDSIPDTITMPLHFKVPAATKILLGQADDATALLEETEEDSQFEYGTTNYVFSDQYIKDGSKFTFEILVEKPDTTNYIYYYYNDYNFDGDYPPSIPRSLTYGDKVEYKLNVKLYIVSGAYYLYHKSVSDFEESDMTMMSEPVTIISNVSGGAGILGSYTTKVFSIGFTRPF